MQLHRLEFQGIGPFAGRHVIDFDALGGGCSPVVGVGGASGDSIGAGGSAGGTSVSGGGQGLFLLEGPTGSGKSTIIDAIAFALFGSTAAQATGEARIRSTHVAPEVETYVDLIVTVARGTYRFRRTPAYQRPKKRGTGTTEEKPSAQLWSLNPEEVSELAGGGEVPPGTPLLSAVREVNQEAENLIGLSQEQFAQTVILPQGEFARFLRATSEEREKILQRIFATEIYQQVQKALQDRAREHRQKLNAAAERLETLASSYLAQASETPDEASDGHDGGGNSDRSDDARASALEGIDSDAAQADGGGAPTDAEGDTADTGGNAETNAAEADAAAEIHGAVTRVVRGEADGVDALEQFTSEHAQRAQQAQDAAEQRRTKAEDAAKQARAHADRQRELARALATRTALIQRQEALAGTKQQATADTERLELAERAARVEVALRAHAQAEQRHESAATHAARVADAIVEQAATDEAPTVNTDEHTALVELAEHASKAASRTVGMAAGESAEASEPVPLHTADATRTNASAEPASSTAKIAAKVRAVERETTQRRGELTELVKLEAALPARRAKAEAGEKALAKWRNELAARRETLDARPAQREELTQQLATQRTAADAAPAATAAEQQARTRLEAARKTEEAEAALKAAQEELATASAAARDAVAKEHELRQRRIDGIAGELAVGLQDGVPCAVCGSPEHPDPAKPGPDQPTQQQIAAAEETREAAETAQGIAQAQVAGAQASLEGLRDQSCGLTVAEAEDAHAAACAALTAAQEAAEMVSKLEEQRDKFDADTTTVQQQAERLANEIAAQQATLDAARDTLAADTATVEATRGEHDTIAAKASALDALTASANKLAAALEALTTAAAQAQQTREAAHHALIEQQFDNAEDAQAALLPTAEREELTQRIAERRTEEQRVSDGLAVPEIAALTGKETADVEAAGAAETRASAAATHASEYFAEARAHTRRLQEAGEQLVGEARQQVAGVTESAPYVRLANLATAGQGSLTQIPLSSFVLVRRFEDMLDAANSRLLAMSSGRYELTRTDKEEGQRARKIGLGLEVIDHQTETSRAPNTLSGGETFYVSLSLALGLADVVRAEAGGVELGTLLIDEGFGSLDQQTLDTVMAELLRLRDAGRTVGLVSHITEMQRMIQDKIEVRRQSQRGSTLTVNWLE